MLPIPSIDKLENHRRKVISSINIKNTTISLSAGTCSHARGVHEIANAFKEAISSHQNEITLKITGCHGFCAAEPDVIIFPEGIFYKNLTVDDPPRIIESVLKNEIIEELLVDENGEKFLYMDDIPFYRHQTRNLLGDNSLIDPLNIEDYISIGGYKALSKALQMHPDKIIEIIKHSGLRGRGGAGFPMGKKWEAVKNQKNDIKYIICNADEGDPGAYMDRSLLEGNPQLIIEGMIIGGYAIGARKGWIYVRNEYPMAVFNVSFAINSLKEQGLLGKNILGSGFNFDIEIIKGGGAFVCGEETALIYSIEGKRGTPRQRPPYPARKGLFGQPTVINNVETWANVPKIIEKGASWFSSIGTENSKGTKIFSLVGKVKNTGLVEVPMGITINEIIYNIGGGSATGKNIKAIQTGGPSGGCIPIDLFNLSIDYESLKQIGSIMGSGGMIVMDEDTCMVDFARYYTDFLQAESCGKCVPCREGTQRMYEILTDITLGNSSIEHIDLLEELGTVIKDTSLCGLGQTAANPLLSTIKYFKDEYLAHVIDKKCPSGTCRALIRYKIDAETCTGCGSCKKNCPEKAISGDLKEPHSIDQNICTKCGICREVCKFDSIIRVSGGME
ncbi:MAG: NADH-quinone oxidoreductase subunit NuoF [Candidatus Lokiarchaeota archaeon]|nr:NADH-quinone oxidoreductase subunit NuoF [Candidatus Lokiarchaeota archaeon]